MTVIGVDEAGRGPLVGNVVAAAVVLGDKSIDNMQQLDDSKKLTEKKREELYHQLITSCDYAIGEASATEIDDINIHHATLLAMRRAIEKLLANKCYTQVEIIIDGKYTPVIESSKALEIAKMHAVIKADSLFACVSAASIIAKVTRDRQMYELHQQYPMYGFDQHKGYPTKRHREAILKYGILAQYRHSYRIK